MERRRHTPGPWVLEPEQEHSNRAVVSSFSDDGNRVMKITIDTFNMEGDGSIVLAAPDLLGALKELCDRLGPRWFLEQGWVDPLSAIAKAEGRQ